MDKGACAVYSTWPHWRCHTTQLEVSP